MFYSKNNIDTSTHLFKKWIYFCIIKMTFMVFGWIPGENNIKN